MALEANKAIAAENQQLRDALIQESGEWQWHDAAHVGYGHVDSHMDMMFSSSLKVLAKDTEQAFLMSDTRESPLPASMFQHTSQMEDQAREPSLSHQHIKDLNMHSPGKAAPSANMCNNPVGLQHSSSEIQAVKLAPGARTVSQTPSVKIQQSVPAQSSLETQPFCGVYPPGDTQGKRMHSMCSSPDAFNCRATAASPPHRLQVDNSQGVPSCVLSTVPQDVEQTLEFSALNHMQAADACTLAPFSQRQLPNFSLDNDEAHPVARESMRNPSSIVSQPSGGSAQQPRNIIRSRDSVSGLADHEEQISNQQASPQTASTRMRMLPPGITTIVVRNIPARLSQDQLLQLWPPDGTYDLMYLPYSFQTNRRSGLVFINMVSHEAALNFAAKWHGHKIAHVSGIKRLDIGVATVQGFVENLKYLKASNIARMHNERFLPVAFKGTQKLDFKSLVAGLQLGTV